MTFGMPYMGSKSDIVASLALNFPKADHFYDLFGGGGSVTHYMSTVKKHWYKQFHYNELESSTAELFQKAINGDFNYDKFKPEWISRERFHAEKETDAYIRICWSFGNNQNNYLYSETIEDYKRSAHIAIVFDKFDDISTKILGFDKWPNEVKTIKQKRLYWVQKVRFNLKDKLKAQDRTMQNLERLEQLQKLQQLPTINITSRDYRQVNIEPNSVVYCDIPYKNKWQYLREFNHSDFFDWAASRDFPVFISEYGIDDSRFKLVYEIGKTVNSAPIGKTKTNANYEKLYWNGKELKFSNQRSIASM